MTTLFAWALDWGVSSEAISDLQRRMGLMGQPTAPELVGGSESAAQALVRLEAAKQGWPMWRNNVGALLDQRGRPVRYGLANDSPALNARVKSADLIGIRPMTVAGRTIGQFVSREIKAPGWRYTGTPREQSQLRWAEIILALGGDAAFACGPGSL